MTTEPTTNPSSIDWSQESNSSGPVEINPVKRKSPRTMEDCLRMEVEKLRAERADFADALDCLKREFNKLHSENQELILRRSETVAMCEQLRAENDRLRGHLRNLGYVLLADDASHIESVAKIKEEFAKGTTKVIPNPYPEPEPPIIWTADGKYGKGLCSYCGKPNASEICPACQQRQHVTQRTLAALRKFAEALESGDISGYRITRVAGRAELDGGESVEFLRSDGTLPDLMKDPDSWGK